MKTTGRVWGKLMALVSVAVFGATAYGTIISSDDAAERIVLTNRVVLVFTNATGTLKVHKPGQVDVLVVGGGGGGGGNSTDSNTKGYQGGGGGGAGAVIYKTALSVGTGLYNVVVGRGGVAGTTASSLQSTTQGENGGDSSVFGLVARGGGGGAKAGGEQGSTGGCGGGSTTASSSAVSGGLAMGDTDNLGFAGGGASHQYGAGGGGGAGEVGETVTGSTPGKGGNGRSYDIVGTNVCYAGGGAGFRRGQNIAGGAGGGGSCSNTVSNPGEDGLGGGGCGGAKGGCGVVIVSYALGDTFDDADNFALAGGDYTISLPDEEIANVFTNSGTLTVTGEGTVEILVVGGGGGGGSGSTTQTNYGGAGGGGGGVAHFASLPVAAGTYPIVIGAGGEVDANGGNSTALGVIAFGGGAGARYDSRNTSSTPNGIVGNDGASGGGACHSSYYPGGSYSLESPDYISGGGVTPAYALYGNVGHDGGRSAHQFAPGGGGGAGAPGGDSYDSTPGAGGNGLLVAIAGRDIYYGGGGAGARYGAVNYTISGGLGGGGGLLKGVGQDGVNGLGGGGAGSCKGGSGVVIVRYHKKNYVGEFKDATGGTVRRRKGYTIHTFTNEVSTFTMPCDGKVEILLVGGGGGGGENRTDANSGYQGGAGGGAGGVVHLTNVVLTVGDYPIRIGAGGAISANGGNTEAFGWVAYGGGAGANYDGRGSHDTIADLYGKIGASGASGGGSTHVFGEAYLSEIVAGGTAIYGAQGNLGHDGGRALHVYGAGGGGGAGGVGNDSNGSLPGEGGIGYECDISGTMAYYAGGGAGFRKGQNIAGGLGGGGSCANTVSNPGTDGLGGGGCGGAKGGSGVVIIRYKHTPVGMVMSFK